MDNVVYIQAKLTKPSFKQEYFMKKGAEVSKISKSRYQELYDKSWGDQSIVVLGPITVE